MVDEFSEGMTAGFFVGIAITLLVGGALVGLCSHDWHKEAIQHNAARWTVDSKTGITTFKWNDEP